MDPYLGWKYLHILMFVFWVGTDQYTLELKIFFVSIFLKVFKPIFEC